MHYEVRVSTLDRSLAIVQQLLTATERGFPFGENR